MLSQFSFQERKRFWTIFVMVVVLLCLWLFFAPNGVLRYYRLRQEIEAVKNETTSLEDQNSILLKDVQRLQNDPAYLEDVARDEYDLIRKNEMVFDFTKRGKKH